MKKLSIELLTEYLVTPTINAVKADILKLNASIIETKKPIFTFKENSDVSLSLKIKNPHRNLVRMLLKLFAYSKQSDLLPEKWEIEHILPQKWQNTYFPNIGEDIIKEKIEHIGNKVPFEKRLNIVASNGYFGKKKKEYVQSKVVVTKELSDYPGDEWNLDDIGERDTWVSDAIMAIIHEWNETYRNLVIDDEIDLPTQEQLELIAQFRNKGWV